MDIAAALTKLNLRIGDTDNFMFTSDEKTQALTEAFNDDSVVRVVWDSTQTFSYTTYQYAIPSTLTALHDIYVSKSNTSIDEPEKVDGSLWEQVGSNFQFKNGANNFIGQGFTLYLKGVKKYTTADTIAETNLQEYVLKLAQLILYTTALNKKSFNFLNNDTSVSEIVTSKRELERDVAKYRQRLPRSFQAA